MKVNYMLEIILDMILMGIVIFLQEKMKGFLILEKEEKETQTNKIEMKIERNKFSINKEEDLEKEVRKSLKKT